ncbi:MAG TPA: hypothetical protein VG055_14705 [Planctomycetaceae bacterium]|jgi:hypothetical protein|nr:hypothetical protein [Planctomycetaceae bacterium]
MKPLRHPIQVLSRAKRAGLLGVTLLVGFVLWYALQRLNLPLKTPEASWGIASLEFSDTVESSQEIVNSWNLTARENAKSGLLLDFLFPLCYSTVITIACFWAASLFRERGFRKTAWLATVIAWLQWPAAVCDYVDNIALWIQLRGPIQDPWPAIARDSATIKFALVAAGLCVVVGAAVILVLRRRVQPAPIPPPAQAPVVRSTPSIDGGIRPVPSHHEQPGERPA